MQQTCPRCGGVSDASSRFCTNCGNVLEPPQRYRQSWEAPPAQNVSQVPPWAQPSGGAYQQQQMNNGQGGGFGFGGQNDATVRKLLTIVGITVLSAVLLLIICITLAIVVPIPGVRSFFLIVALVLLFIARIIYHQIRRIIRRTVGRIWWFL